MSKLIRSRFKRKKNNVQKTVNIWDTLEEAQKIAIMTDIFHNDTDLTSSEISHIPNYKIDHIPPSFTSSVITTLCKKYIIVSKLTAFSTGLTPFFMRIRLTFHFNTTTCPLCKARMRTHLLRENPTFGTEDYPLVDMLSDLLLEIGTETHIELANERHSL